MRQTVNANKPQKVDEVKGEIKMNTNINMKQVPTMTVHEAFTLDFITQPQLSHYLDKKVENLVVIPQGMMLTLSGSFGAMEIYGHVFASRKLVCKPSDFEQQVLWVKPMPTVDKQTEQESADSVEVPMSPYFVARYHPMFLSEEDGYYYSMARQIKSEFDGQAMYVGRYRWNQDKCGWFRDYHAGLMNETRQTHFMVDYYERLDEEYSYTFSNVPQLHPVYDIETAGCKVIHSYRPYEEILQEVINDTLMAYDIEDYTPTEKELEEMKERAAYVADRDAYDPNNFEQCSWIALGHPHGFNPSNE